MPIKFRPFSQLPKESSSIFWSYVLADDPNKCWPWLGSEHISGYGQFCIDKASWPAHRVAFYLHYGIDPSPDEVCHHCDNRFCCNPFHLFRGSHQDNMQDCIRKGRFVQVSVATGITHYRARFTEQDIRDIRLLYSQGHSCAHIGKVYNTYPMTIWYVVARKTWKHIL